MAGNLSVKSSRFPTGPAIYSRTLAGTRWPYSRTSAPDCWRAFFTRLANYHCPGPIALGASRDTPRFLARWIGAPIHIVASIASTRVKMQSQQQSKGEVIAELRGKTDSFSIKDISSSGVKMENNDVGQITGKYQGSFMETISINMKYDGKSEWEGKVIKM